jgi:hypothetical protein
MSADLIWRLLLAAGLGAVLGLEREAVVRMILFDRGGIVVEGKLGESESRPLRLLDQRRAAGPELLPALGSLRGVATNRPNCPVTREIRATRVISL